MDTIGDRIERILTERGWSQRELARRADLAEPHVGILLRRYRDDPNAEVELGTLRKIADAADVSLHWLQTGGEVVATVPEEASPMYGNRPDYPQAERKARAR